MISIPTPKRAHESDVASKPIPPLTDPNALIIAVTPRRIRLFAVVTLVLGTIVALTLVFLHGVELERFNGITKSQSARTKLLNHYNSYTGTIITIFVKPMEQFVAMAIQVVALRMLSRHMTQPLVSWKLKAVILGFVAGTGYLIGNGFNALNVQLRPEIRPRISFVDLSRASDVVAVSNISTIEKTLSEKTPYNPTANTFLRNLVLTSAPRPPTQCPWSEISDNTSGGDIPDHSLQTGFPRQDWFAHVLPHALTPQTLKVMINPTNNASNAAVRLHDLPMNATLAADLVLYTMLYARFIIPFGNPVTFELPQEIFGRFPFLQVTQWGQKQQINGTMAEILGLLPTTPADEMTQRDMLLRGGGAKLVARQFSRGNSQENYLQDSDISMEFSHINISPSIHFDAVTFEFEMLPSKLANARSRDNSTWFTNLEKLSNCAQWPGLCLINKVKFPAEKDTKNESTSQVQAFSPCVGEDGTERIFYQLNSTAKDFEHQMLCPRTSNTSMIVLSFAKRLVADSITQNTIQNASGTFKNTKYVH